MKKQIAIIGLCIGLTQVLSSCHKFLDAPEPPDLIVDNQVWSSDSLTAGILNTTLAVLSTTDLFSGGSGMSINFGTYTDELMPALDTLSLFPYYHCDVAAGDSYVFIYWSDLYRRIYACNAVIAGAGASTSLVHRQQWLGEAYFLRALQYFYLTNLFGDIPLTTSTDYSTNNTLSRSPQEKIYQQIVDDCKMAITLLDDSYHDGNGNPTTDHGRPNRSAAGTLLARAYLYQGDWPDAEAAAGTVINDPQYSLVDPLQTFNANSAESIWQLAPSRGGVDDYNYLDKAPATIPPSTLLFSYVVFKMTDSLVNAFEPGDARLRWTRTVVSTTPPQTLYLAAKYNTSAADVQYIMMCRLAELYLIRSEARAQQGNIVDALSDLNIIRQRAQLSPLNLTDASALLAAIAHENRIEFFAEEAHRFFDLRRTGMLDAVETADGVFKSNNWQTYKKYLPIPASEILINPNLTQNPGY